MTRRDITLGSLSGPLRYAAPLLVLAVATAMSVLVLPALADAGRLRLMSIAVALDFTVIAPLLVYLLLVRSGRLPWIAVVPVFVAGNALATATLPEQMHPLVKALELAAIPAELALIVYLVVLTRRALAAPSAADGDVVTRFRETALRVVGVRLLADVLTTEVMILYYAFCPRRAAPVGERSFTLHHEAGYQVVLIALSMAVVVETFALHLLVRLWSAAAAYVLTGLSLYALAWLVGDFRAIVARPVRFTATHLLMRLGLRWEADIPLDRIGRVEILAQGTTKPPRGAFVAAVLGQPNVKVTLDAPVEAIGAYGRRRSFAELWLRVDDAAKLHADLSEASSRA